jgi:hypothetical protein
VIVPSVRVVALVGIGVSRTSRYCSPCSSIIGLKLSAGTFIRPISIGKLGTTPKVGRARRPFSKVYCSTAGLVWSTPMPTPAPSA